jgi:transposase
VRPLDGRSGAAAAGLLPQKKSLRPAERDREDVAEARRARRPRPGRGGRPIFLDETGVRTDLTRTHGRSERGRRVGEPVPHGRWKTVTVVSAIGPGGAAATPASEGACDGPAFAAYAERALEPALRPGDVAVADDLAAHEGAAAARSAADAGAELRFLPAYSPGLNPIERMWPEAKGRLRSAAARSAAARSAAARSAAARSAADRSASAIYDALGPALGPALAAVTAADCRAWCRGCGYTLR